MLQRQKLAVDLDRLAGERVYDPVDQTILLSAATGATVAQS